MNPFKSVLFLSCLPLILPDTGNSYPIVLGGDWPALHLGQVTMGNLCTHHSGATLHAVIHLTTFPSMRLKNSPFPVQYLSQSFLRDAPLASTLVHNPLVRPSVLLSDVCRLGTILIVISPYLTSVKRLFSSTRRGARFPDRL